ncbi:DUF3329 domain-containing protein [Thalassococcus profundi]|uniref:DUF3329 domain-containing protein n=1 Tax=Thalassococcus profundi TaxID=2282382 RepID=A0A369TQW4_9RHOB|nr:DUF3329 domain-containing protein [Thalassococcus profundi]RDD66517.1 DUF3329 domain-containing protein [Thalassococcus profundi]
MLDPDDPFYAPLWRRIVIVAVAAGWGLFELSQGNSGWALVFGGLGAWAAWAFFLRKTPDDPE